MRVMSHVDYKVIESEGGRGADDERRKKARRGMCRYAHLVSGNPAFTAFARNERSISRVVLYM